MKPVCSRNMNSKGFTLIEVIVAIILAAILGLMVVQYTGSNLRATVESLVATRNNADAVTIMERITRDYRNWLEDSPDETLEQFQTYINNNYSARTQMIELRPEDPANAILRVIVSRGDRKLASLFTK